MAYELKRMAKRAGQKELRRKQLDFSSGSAEGEAHSLSSRNEAGAYIYQETPHRLKMQSLPCHRSRSGK